MKPRPTRILEKRVREIAPLATHERESGILLLNMALQPVASDHGAWNILRRAGLTDGKPHVLSLPPELVAAINSRRANDEFSGKVSISVANRQYCCHFYIVQSDTQPVGPNFVAVHFDVDLCHSDDSVHEIAAEYKLTAREEQTLCGIALGLSTKELADRMKISPNTVKSFVRLIMIKLGVTSRNAIMVKLLEISGSK